MSLWIWNLANSFQRWLWLALLGQSFVSVNSSDSPLLPNVGVGIFTTRWLNLGGGGDFSGLSLTGIGAHSAYSWDPDVYRKQYTDNSTTVIDSEEDITGDSLDIKIKEIINIKSGGIDTIFYRPVHSQVDHYDINFSLSYFVGDDQEVEQIVTFGGHFLLPDISTCSLISSETSSATTSPSIKMSSTTSHATSSATSSIASTDISSVTSSVTSNIESNIESMLDLLYLIPNLFCCPVLSSVTHQVHYPMIYLVLLIIL